MEDLFCTGVLLLIISNAIKNKYLVIISELNFLINLDVKYVNMLKHIQVIKPAKEIQ